MNTSDGKTTLERAGTDSPDADSAAAKNVEARRARWLDENREAFVSTQSEFERRGLLLADVLAVADCTRPRSAEEQKSLDAP